MMRNQDTKFTPEILEKAWIELGDIPVDEDERIELQFSVVVDAENFALFGVGTHREEIWHWFDEQYPHGVAYLMRHSRLEVDMRTALMHLEDILFNINPDTMSRPLIAEIRRDTKRFLRKMRDRYDQP